MPGLHPVSLPRQTLAGLLAFLLLLSACTSGPTLAPAPEPDATSTPLSLIEPDLLLLPDAFRYEMKLHSVGAPEEPVTVIVGQYRAGALAQTARRGEDLPEELVVAPDPTDGVVRSYTHAPDEPNWTRWPGMGFDAIFGLASPFSALRLYPLADVRSPAEPETPPDAPEAALRVQTIVSAATIERLLRAGASVVADSAEQRNALEFQLAPLLVPQTITYWASEQGRVYQAAATLLTTETDGQPVPWLEILWRYWDYDDPAISVAAPAAFTDAIELSPIMPDAELAAGGDAPLAPDTSLRVRVFANPGVPATDATVTIYPATKNQALEASEASDAQFSLPAGVYDVQVRAEKAETWLRDVVVVAETVASHDVLFDFGTLVLIVTKNGARPHVDTVIYPAGQRQIWSDWQTENPAIVRLPAGAYDLEVALPDLSGTRRFEGVQVRAGETVTATIELGQ